MAVVLKSFDASEIKISACVYILNSNIAFEVI